MQPDEYILNKLGAGAYASDEQALLLEQVRTLIGEAVSEHLTVQQQNEYKGILYDNELLIDLWLKQHIPEYKNSIVYQQLVEAAKIDPEQNRPEKLFASIAWIELNVPNAKEITDKVIDDFKKQRQATS